MACKWRYFWSITASSEENLLLRGSFRPDGEGEGTVRRRWTQEQCSCYSTCAYLSLMSHICLKMMLLFQISCKSLLRWGRHGDGGGASRRRCWCRKRKKAMRSAVKLLRLKLLSYSFRNSSETIGSLKNRYSFSSRPCERASQNKNFQTSRYRDPDCFRSCPKQRLTSFSLATRPNTSRTLPSERTAPSPSPTALLSSPLRSSTLSCINASSHEHLSLSLISGWILLSYRATSAEMSPNKLRVMSGSSFRERAVKDDTSSLLQLSHSIISI